MNSVELFAGCGGLAFGIAEAGFKHVLVVESDPQASATLAANKRRRVPHFVDWPLLDADVRTVDYANIQSVDLVSGGPPCQPFSIGGKHKGPTDRRNMWPEAIRAVRVLCPKAFLFENVRGLLRPAFADYLDFIRLQLTWPERAPRGRGWREHLRTLRRVEMSGVAPSYHVLVQGINAADYGAPQRRHRAIVMGVRADVASEIAFPVPTHSRAALLWSQRVSHEYWERHDVSISACSPMSDSDRCLVKQLRKQSKAPRELPWVTVRDAIGDLPRPTIKDARVPNHVLHPGARVYPRHTGSSWDEPAKALKAGDHGVPGGENVIVSRSGAVRYFTIREMARLQGFPDEFEIAGTWKGPIRQLGNAVPVEVGRVFARELGRLIGQGPARGRRAA